MCLHDIHRVLCVHYLHDIKTLVCVQMQDVEVGSPKASSYSGKESACSGMSPTTPLQQLDSGTSTNGASTNGTSGRGSSALNSGAFTRQKIPSTPVSRSDLP